MPRWRKVIDFLTIGVYYKAMMQIPKDKLCDNDCGQLAIHFSAGTGRFMCAKSANSCPTNKLKNSMGLKKAHAEGRAYEFTKSNRTKSNAVRRKNLVEQTPFELLGHKLRKNIVLEDQNYCCSHCGLAQWMGLRITLELDHIDGNRKNNVRANLRCLCPNCHSITDTWKIGSIKKKGTKNKTDNEIIEAYLSSNSMTETLKKLEYNWGSVNTVKNVLFRHNILNKK